MDINHWAKAICVQCICFSCNCTVTLIVVTIAVLWWRLSCSMAIGWAMVSSLPISIKVSIILTSIFSTSMTNACSIITNWCTTMSTNIFTLSTSSTIYTVSITFLSFTMCHCSFTTLSRIIPITSFTTVIVISIICALSSPPRVLILGSSMALGLYGQTPAFLNPVLSHTGLNILLRCGVVLKFASSHDV